LPSRIQFGNSPAPGRRGKLAIRSIYFPTGLPSRARPNAGLLESQQRTLTSLASDYKEYLASRPNAHLVLEGHADSRGPAESNQRVSERRVEATKRFLTGLGIPEANLETKSFGEEQAMTSEQVRELVVQHPNLSQEQKDKIMKNLRKQHWAAVGSPVPVQRRGCLDTVELGITEKASSQEKTVAVSLFE